MTCKNPEARRAYKNAWQNRQRRDCDPEQRKANQKRYYEGKGRATRQNWGLKARYGLTREDYDRMLANQDYACQICNAEAWMERGGVLSVDHDHATGKVRGLLCRRCNRALGLLRDNRKILESAILYLDISW